MGLALAQRTARIGALVLIGAMFLPRARAESYEDFFGGYFGWDGPPAGVDKLPAVNSWFFPAPAVVTLLAALFVLRIVRTAELQPRSLASLEDSAWSMGILLPLWIAGSWIAFPALDGPPFHVLPAAWVGMAAALVTSAGLLSLGRLARSASSPADASESTGPALER